MRFASICASSVCVLLMLGCHHSGGPAAVHYSVIGSSDRALEPGQLVTGKHISDPEERQLVGSWPMNMIATADGRFAITTDMGFKESVWSIDTAGGLGVSHVNFSNQTKKNKGKVGGQAATETAPSAADESNGLYYGLAAAPNGTIFAAQGAHDSIAVLAMDANGGLSQAGEIATKPGDFPAGIALDQRGMLMVANNTSGGDDPYRSAGSVAIYQLDADGAEGREIGRCELPDRFNGTSGFPLAIAVLGDGSKTYVDSERDDAVYVIDTSDAAHPKMHATIHVGAHPVGMTLSADQQRLFVANSQSDTVSIIDTGTDQQIATVLLRPEQARGLPGTTPLAVALSPDQNTLYAALADMNAVAVVDISDTKLPVLRGYLSTGWYPSALIATPDGKRLLVADAKGSAAMNPNDHMPSTRPSDRRSYILNLIAGDVRSITLPDAGGLAAATKKVLAQNDLPAVQRPSTAHTAAMGLASHRIEHVFYIIKENRTYDQVLGDLPEGNGDSSLTLFGRDLTPNLHALAERFVLLDSTYCCGEVSGDGWNWSTQGMANAYISRNVPYNYSERGRKFDFEGQNNGYPTAGFPKAYTVPYNPTGLGEAATTGPVLSQGGEPIPDMGSTGHHLWDEVRTAGLSLRNYGFFLYFADENAGIVGDLENFPTVPGLRPGGHDLAGISDVDYRRFDLDYPDSSAPDILFQKTGNYACLYPKKSYGNANAGSRYAEWKREFDLMLAKDASGASVPALTLLRMGNDHTTGMSAGDHSPKSMVADNDFGIGEVVEAISHSPIWKSSAIFVIEDDAQSGEDHVDAHRTTCFVISPWIKRHGVDHRFYNTDSVLKTMELLLGIPPMTQYEAIAAAIDDWDAKPNNLEPYDAILPAENVIADVNPQPQDLSAGDPVRRLVELSDRMDFRRADAAPTALLNEVVWKSVRGVHSEPPARRVSNALPTGKEKDDDDDDDKGDGD